MKTYDDAVKKVFESGARPSEIAAPIRDSSKGWFRRAAEMTRLSEELEGIEGRKARQTAGVLGEVGQRLSSLAATLEVCETGPDIWWDGYPDIWWDGDEPTASR